MQELQRWAFQNIKRIRTLNNEVQKSFTSPITIEDSMKKSAQFGMAEQGPSTAFQHLEVPIHSLGANTMLKPPQGMECNNTSPKTIEEFVKKSAQFGYGRTGSQFGISTSGGANT
jgi:hypothetical protein